MTDAIRAIYRQVDAPEWAAANLDALADVLRDLSWLPEGPVELSIDQAPWDVIRVLRQVEDDTAASVRPVRVVGLS